MEEFVLAAQRSDFRLDAVGENQERVVIEQMGDRVEIVRVIIDVGVLHVHGVLFQLNDSRRLVCVKRTGKEENVGKAYWYTPLSISEKAQISDTVLDYIEMFQENNLAMQFK